MFNALVVNRDGDNDAVARVQSMETGELPGFDDRQVTVAVEYSTVNYKDGLCLRGDGGGLVRRYPHVPGIDFAGTVTQSADDRYRAGDRVVLTGWRVGEKHWGGFSQMARVDGDWLVPLPDDLTPRRAMAIGTAGLAAMLAVMSLEDHGLRINDGPVLVTGASGGVGSIATAVLGSLGYCVAAVTGRPEAKDYLLSLGATRIIDRGEIDHTTGRPLESETWAGCVDAVGGDMLARVIGQLKYGASVAAVGLAGGAALPTSVIPFLLRGVNLLGIDSVMQPYENRVAAWSRLAANLPIERFDSMTRTVSLSEVPKIGEQILAGQVRGRVVVDLNS